jgi:hypothetical protein
MPFRDPISFYAAKPDDALRPELARESALLTSRRMRAWGLNTAYGPTLNDTLPAGSTSRQPYVYPLRGWQMIEGAIMGLPDVYSDAFARRVDTDAAQQLDPRKEDPWMIGYFIGNEPPWPARESSSSTWCSRVRRANYSNGSRANSQGRYARGTQGAGPRGVQALSRSRQRRRPAPRP